MIGPIAEHTDVRYIFNKIKKWNPSSFMRKHLSLNIVKRYSSMIFTLQSIILVAVGPMSIRASFIRASIERGDRYHGQREGGREGGNEGDGQITVV